MEGFTRTDMSPAARTLTKELIGDLADQIVNDIARDRQLEVTQVRALLDQGLITAPEAHKAKLVDRLDHADALTGFLREQVGAKADDDEAVMFVRPGNYRALTTPSPTLSERLGLGTDDENAKPVVATITIKGPIYAEHEGGSPLMGDLGNQTSDDHVSAIRAAADDDAVKAIVVRIDSPGGTPTAAEDIRRALMVARTEKKKLVVVSMGGLAASGGYWVATAGQTIFAERATLTGSIGVVGGKFDISGLSQKLGVTWDGEAVGENVAMFSPHRGFSPSERARIEAMMDQTYAYFTDLVADARNLKPDAVDALARGRVWTGARATAGGLVDQVGGYQDALAYVAKELKVASIDDLVVEPYPAELSPLERILELLHGQAMMGRMASTIHNVLAHRPYSGIYALSDVSVGP
jgi:protease-4